MDIYLVRISERSDGSLFVERKPNATTNDHYIAISHVWGTPETIQPTYIDGVGIVQLSPGKKDILSILRRENVCGDKWFWMDLFCIDQADGALISIADQLMAIPSIYKSSQCVKVLIETPVCENWQNQVSEIISSGSVDTELFEEQELKHARKCPHMLFSDPWFERLWTRQEGLYGLVLEVVVLNPVPCSRLHPGTFTAQEGWKVEGKSVAKRTTVEFFFFDKLTYHGLDVSQVEKSQFCFYLDFVYRHRVDVTVYGGTAGPAMSYSPILEAWRSSRITTKARDYVLAVFPDIHGYAVPAHARKMSFHELVTNALGQSTIKERFDVASRVPKGMMMGTSSKLSTTPWLLQNPSSVSEAYDSLLVCLPEKLKTATDAKFFMVARNVKLEELDLSRSNMSEIKNVWDTTTDIIRHVVYVSPTGPCTGTMTRDVDSDQSFLHRYFVHQFMPSAVERYLAPSKFGALNLTSAKILSFDRVKNIADDVFSCELRRFLVSLICGTTLFTADVILQSADFRTISMRNSKLLALIRRQVLSKPHREDFALMSTTLWHMHGFFVGSKTDGAWFVVGRTAVPNSKIWDDVQV
ncbi:hypothetical protein L218DRAFT_998940 [Marasmius fiardii PR-910]|nr:hypothetical protein L218DRAFT_998940 [Marasmius fiardii PR-910]